MKSERKKKPKCESPQDRYRKNEVTQTSAQGVGHCTFLKIGQAGGGGGKPGIFWFSFIFSQLKRLRPIEIVVFT